MSGLSPLIFDLIQECLTRSARHLKLGSVKAFSMIDRVLAKAKTHKRSIGVVLMNASRSLSADTNCDGLFA